MAVVIDTPRAFISGMNLPKALWDTDTINQLAAQLVAQHVETFIEMSSECKEELTTFSAAESYLKGAQESVEDYVEDMLQEFRDALFKSIASRTITVSSIQIGKDGLMDADVVVV